MHMNSQDTFAFTLRFCVETRLCYNIQLATDTPTIAIETQTGLSSFFSVTPFLPHFLATPTLFDLRVSYNN